VVKPFGTTLPFSVAPLSVTDVAAETVASGAALLTCAVSPPPLPHAARTRDRNKIVIDKVVRKKYFFIFMMNTSF
jgi:hypothetical protein